MRLVAALLIFVLLSSCALAQEGFEPLHFSLRGNLSRGYEWSCEYQDNGVLSAPMEDFIADGDGGDGTFEYYFGVNQPGQAQIVFNYGPTMGIAPPSQTVVCTVNVHADGENTVFWAQIYADDGTIMFILPANPTTGMDWNYTGDDSGVVSFIGEDYAADFVDLEGAGGQTTYFFRAEKPGKTLLMFNYSDMWNPYAAAQHTYAAEVIVGENMEISLAVENSWGGGEYDSTEPIHDGVL